MTIRSQIFLFFAVLFIMFGMGTCSAHLYRSRGLVHLSQTLQEDLDFILDLVRAKGLLQQAELSAENYLLSGDRFYLEAYRSATRDLEQVLPPGNLPVSPEMSAQVESLRRGLIEELREQQSLIRSKHAGQLSTEEAVEIVRRTSRVEQLQDEARAIQASRTAALRELPRQLAEESFIIFLGLLGIGLVSTWLVSTALANRVVRPINELRHYLERWKLGNHEPLSTEKCPFELQGLTDQVNSLLTRLNEQHESELELGRMKSALFSLVSHEFYNALTVIEISSRILIEPSEPGELSPKKQMAFRALSANVRSLETLAKNILNMSRLGSERFILELQELDLLELIENCAERIRPMVETKGISLNLDVPAAPLYVKGDWEALSLVIANLLSNAVKYTRDRGTIELSVAKEDSESAGSRVIVSVRDTGIGIAADQIDAVFGEFYRTGEGQKAAGGFGLGLALARRLLAAHDSELRVESTPGQGSRFFFSLRRYSGTGARRLGQIERKEVPAFVSLH